MLRRFSGLSCSKCCFYSLIFAFIISLGCINTAHAYVCFLPDSSDCAQGDTEGFWPCVGSDCEGGENGKCDASYNSNRSTNECGAACTKCADSNSPYNGLYKCPENTCNCNDYTSDNSYNECGESCSVCRIAGDKNYGKYKCKPVPATGCPNPCKDCTLTEAQARAKMASNPCMECEQCANLNCSDDQRAKWHCSENRVCKQCKDGGYNKTKNSSEYIESQQTCSRMQCEECPYNDISEGIEWYKCGECGSEYTHNFNNLTQQQIENHCYANQTCGCFMECDKCFGYDNTLQDCQNKGYDSAKNPCPKAGKRGTVYQMCCNKCNGYRYSSDLSKTSEGWQCSSPCINYCYGGGGPRWSCSCKKGYHTEGGNCVLNQCTSGVAENTCRGPGYTFVANNTSFTNTNGDTVRCGTCKEFCSSEDYPYAIDTGFVVDETWLHDAIRNGVYDDFAEKLSSPYVFYTKYDVTKCGSGSECFESFRDNSAIITRGGTGDPYLFSKIDSSSEHCTIDGTYIQYKSLCNTSSKSNIGNLSDPKLGESVLEIDCIMGGADVGETVCTSPFGMGFYEPNEDAEAELYPINSAKYVRCFCDNNNGHYDNEGMCEQKTGKNCAQVNSLCYGTCESFGLYSDEASCKKNITSSSETCQTQNNGCYAIKTTKAKIICEFQQHSSNYNNGIYNEALYAFEEGSTPTSICGAFGSSGYVEAGTYNVCWTWSGNRIEHVTFGKVYRDYGDGHYEADRTCYSTSGNYGCESAVSTNTSGNPYGLCIETTLVAGQTYVAGIEQ